MGIESTNAHSAAIKTSQALGDDRMKVVSGWLKRISGYGLGGFVVGGRANTNASG